ncbi:MAG: hypothetical protein ACP5VF_08535 [Acidobacteriota bacterium]
MRRRIGGGIPATLTSSLLMAYLLSFRFCWVVLAAVLTAQSDPAWTLARTLLGPSCSGSFFLMGVLLGLWGDGSPLAARPVTGRPTCGGLTGNLW